MPAQVTGRRAGAGVGRKVLVGQTSVKSALQEHSTKVRPNRWVGYAA